MKQRFTGKDSSAHSNSEKDTIFNALLALYAGEDLDLVIEQLDSFADRFPEEVGFYIPQLCTYLFHVSSPEITQLSETNPTDQTLVGESPLKMGGQEVHVVMSKPIVTVEETTQNQLLISEESSFQVKEGDKIATDVKERLKEFLLARANKSIKFAHLVFWYLLAGIDDSESI